MSRCILFLRVSTSQQQLESQEASLREQAHKNGFTDEDIFVIKKKESAVKLSEEEREGLQELYQEIEKGDVDCIRIWELSRLSRKMEVLYSIRKRLLDAKVQLYCSNPQFTLLTEDRTKIDKMSDLVFSIFGTLAEQEIIEKKERFARGKREKAAQNKYTGGQVPFGYSVNPETKKIEPEEFKEDGSEGDASVVRHIYNMYENGMSQTAIAKYYYERGRRQINMSLINNILTNESYTGSLSKEETKHASRKGKYSEWTAYPRSYPIIITPEQFQRCREIAKGNNTKISKAHNLYYADGIFRCPICGRKMQAMSGRNIYYCRDAHNINKPYSGSISEERCSYRENFSINAVDAIAWDTAFRVEMILTVTQTDEQIKELGKRIKDVEEKMAGLPLLRKDIDDEREKVGFSYMKGWFSKSRAEAEAKRIDEEAAKLNAREATYREELVRYNRMIEDIRQAAASNSIFKQLSGDNHFLPQILNEKWETKYIDQINANTSDEERYRLVQKNIQKITVRDVRILYNFKYRGVKETKARFFTVTPAFLNLTPTGYIMLSNTGHGCAVFAWGTGQWFENEEDYYDLTQFEKLNPIGVVQRMRDDHKYDKRFRERAERKKKREEEKGDALTIRELAELSGIPASTIHSCVQRGGLIATKHGKEYWIAKADADKYMSIRQTKQKEA